MRRKIKKSLRQILMFLSGVLFISALFLLYYEIKYPDTKEEKVPVYSYIIKPDVKYAVFLKPNILYEEKSLGENQIYFTAYVDYIETEWNYEFNGERPALITGDYEITAVLEGYTEIEKQPIVIWSKKFPIKEKVNLEAKESYFTIKESFPVNLEEYRQFASKVMEETKVNTSDRLSIFMNVNLKVETDKGVIEEKASPSLTIPLNGTYFTITKNQAEGKTGSLDETRTVEIPADQRIITICGIGLGLSFIALLYLLFFTCGVETDLLIKNLNRIFRNHGSRLVALNNEMSVSYDNHCKVRSFDDLVRIADEIDKPIMYEYSSDYKEITQFYVFDSNWMYIFDLSEAIEISNKESSKEENANLMEDISKIIEGKSWSKVPRTVERKENTKDLNL